MKTKKPVKKASSAKVASIAGKYLEMSEEDLHDYIVDVVRVRLVSIREQRVYIQLKRSLIKDIHALAASVLSQREVK